MADSRLPDLVVRSHRGPYTVRFGSPFEGLDAGAANQCIVVDERVSALYRDRFASALHGEHVLVVEATEGNKSLERLATYVTQLIEQGVRRGDVLVAVGGGVIQDIVSFIAGTFLRGLPWAFYPTTLLAQADSCIGSKSSINVGPYKNQLGTFTPPERILVSTDVLATLDMRELRSGIGEIIKTHIIAGPEPVRALSADYSQLFRDPRMLATYVRAALDIKRAKVETDEFDRAERLVLNYGHTFGHAIESATGYAVPHGIAVTIGMDLANFVSARLGILDADVYEELHALLAANYAGFEATPIPSRFFDALARDKKNVDEDVRLVLLRKPGDVFLGRYPLDGRFREICREYLDALPQRRVVVS